MSWFSWFMLRENEVVIKTIVGTGQIMTLTCFSLSPSMPLMSTLLSILIVLSIAINATSISSPSTDLQ